MFINSLRYFAATIKAAFITLLEGAGGNDPPFWPDYLCTLIFKV